MRQKNAWNKKYENGKLLLRGSKPGELERKFSKHVKYMEIHKKEKNKKEE